MNECISYRSRLKSHAIKNNRLHVFDPVEVCKLIRSGCLKLDSISSMHLYICQVKYYGWVEHGTQDIELSDRCVDIFYAVELIKLYVDTVGKNGARVTLVTPSRSARFKEVASDVKDFCDDYGVRHCIQGVRNYVTYPSTKRWLTTDKLNVDVSEDGICYILKNIRSRYMSNDDHPLIVIPNNTDRVADVPIITVEDYCKWYDLYVIDNKEVVGLWGKYPQVADGIQWCDHTVVPYSVVDVCDKYGFKLDAVSYMAICYRFAEDWLGLKDPTDIPADYLADKSRADSVITYDTFGYCEYFGLPWTDYDINKYFR